MIINDLISHSYRVTVDNKTCVFEKETDPTMLRSPTAGKLLHYVLDDGDHVFSGDTYAEMEVNVTPAGQISFLMDAGLVFTVCLRCGFR